MTIGVGVDIITISRIRDALETTGKVFVNKVLTPWEQQRAEAEFQAALAIDPSFVPAMFGMALLCEHRGDLSRAAQWLQDALRVAPNDVNVHYYLACYAMQLGDPATAKSELDTVLTLDPGHAEARRLRATID